MWLSAHFCLKINPLHAFIRTGPVKTGLMRNWPGLAGLFLRLMAAVFFRDARGGAQTVVYCAAVTDDEADSSALRGRLVVDCVGQDISPAASTVPRHDVHRLWNVASEACRLPTEVPSRWD
jgi:hypothetical protein